MGMFAGRHTQSRVAVAAIVAALSLGCEPTAPARSIDAPSASTSAARAQTHVLARAGYGADAYSSALIDAIGVAAYIDAQLRPSAIPDPEIDAMLAARPALSMTFQELVDAYPLDGDTAALPILQLFEMKILRSVHARRQLEQVLVDFWFDHFNVFGADGIVLHAVIPYERDAIRPHVVGRFEDMLRAVASSPAMLYYLDNYQSTKDGFVFMGERRGLNENYARELLELHTVGVDAGYDQQDVIDVARAFTGWTIGPRQFTDPSGFLFWPAAHDVDEKSLMGELRLAAGGGIEDGEDVITYLARHPRTADFLCTKLVVRFVDEVPPPATVQACATAYLAGDGHLGDATRAILLSPEFLDARHAGAKVKRPIHFVASLLRATGLEVDGASVTIPGTPPRELRMLDVAASFVESMGEPLYLAHPPTGFPDDSGHWASAGGLVTRFKLVEALVALGLLDDVDWSLAAFDNASIVDAVAGRLLPGGVDAPTRAAVLAHLGPYTGFPASLRTREAAALILSSPDFTQH